MPYVIDGNNLLGSWGRRPAGAADGRAEVVKRVAAFCRARGARAIVVFDGRPFRSELDRQELGAVSLRFPGEGRDADALVREIVDEAARPGELLVVTSDKALFSYARTRGASVLRAHEWNALAAGAVPPLRAARRRGAAAPSEKPDRETDVEGWLKRFSGE